MLQKANFPTFMGNSLVIDTINLTLPFEGLQNNLAQSMASGPKHGLYRLSHCPDETPSKSNKWKIDVNLSLIHI